jgi:hypothetical protein
VEFLDELVWGAWSAAWPLIRSDLGLSYVQVGLLLSLPAIFGSVVELPLGLLGDTTHRRTLVRAGGLGFAAGLLLLAVSDAFAPLLAALLLLSPSAGAFVGLSQATLMDLDPHRHEHNMARWALAGSVGIVAGPLALSGVGAFGFGWRATFALFVVMTVAALVAVWRAPMHEVAAPAGPGTRSDTTGGKEPRPHKTGEPASSPRTTADPPRASGEPASSPRTTADPPRASGPPADPSSVPGTTAERASRPGPAADRCDRPTLNASPDSVTVGRDAGRAASSRRAVAATLLESARGAVVALRRREVVRWLVLLQCCDLMLDVLHGFLALYFVDVAGVSSAGAALAIVVWTGVGLAGDALLIPLLARVEGTRWLRASAATILLVFPAFLLVPGVPAKLVLLGALGLLNSGWYSILAGRLYSAMPGRSGAVMTLSSAFGLAGGLLPLAIGAAAEAFGLRAAMWLLLAGPIALLAGIPRARPNSRAAARHRTLTIVDVAGSSIQEEPK